MWGEIVTGDRGVSFIYTSDFIQWQFIITKKRLSAIIGC